MTPPRRQTILVIDDDADVREMMALLLSTQGFEVIIASNGMIGIEKFRSMRIDVVIVDVNMPGIDGYQVIDIIRPLAMDGTKIILWSALPIVRRIDGVDVIGKPCGIDELMGKITE